MNSDERLKEIESKRKAMKKAQDAVDARALSLKEAKAELESAQAELLNEIDEPSLFAAESEE